MLLASIVAPVGVTAAERFQLSDADLDLITAGSASASGAQELLTFDVVRRTRPGGSIAADGSLSLLDALNGVGAGNMLVLDRAQNHLHSIININAVNSTVNVLLNLNVSIDSHIGNLNQTNLNGIPPAPTRVPGR